MKRDSVISRVSRRVPPEVTTRTLFGNSEYKRFICKRCKGSFLVGEAYMESPSKRRHDEQIREFCVPCWDISKGKYLPESEPSNSTLVDFFGQEK